MVSMHLLVLSAFRPGIRQPVVDHSGVSMHLLVLSAFRHDLMNAAGPEFRKFQCTFWCSVLSDPEFNRDTSLFYSGFNAPSGAQCFPTIPPLTAQNRPSGFNAPSGAQCFPTDKQIAWMVRNIEVSMHLLVLSAFRRYSHGLRQSLTVWFQCTFWCSVLSDLPILRRLILRAHRFNAPSGAQCFPTVQPHR